MHVVDLIRKKRGGISLSRDELSFLLKGYISGDIPDYQMSAFLMACYFSGMDDTESHDLTDLMLHSGSVLDLSDIPRPKIDKHSTGGVADTVSLLLAPIAASCGIAVPMISGRGLGHTGGTLDKLESIPGFRTDLDVDSFKRTVRDIGVSMIGQTADIAPADKKLYALRDVTGTIESPPLIAGSIMSKKLAAGLDALVLDIKCGDGAFMQDFDQATDLASRLVSIGERAGKQTIAYITDMDQPLGSCIGNWLEIEEAYRGLRGENDDRNSDLMTITHLLTGTMLFLGNRSHSVEEGIHMSKQAIASGAAASTFRALVSAHGGDPITLDGPSPHPPAKQSLRISAEKDGYVTRIHTRELGVSSVLLGAGRSTMKDVIDPMAGIVLEVRKGTQVTNGQTLAIAYSDNTNRLSSSADRLKKCFEIHTNPPESHLLVKAVVSSQGTKLWRSMDTPEYPS